MDLGYEKRKLDLQLIATKSKIHLFAATGHNYPKSGRLYLQLVLALSEQYPWLYKEFASASYHTIRRSKRYGLVFEQIWSSNR
jgi:hypothetical protein